MNLITPNGNKDHQPTGVCQKIPPIYECNISELENFLNSLSRTNTGEFTITQTKNASKLKFFSVDYYRSITKSLDEYDHMH